jgi:glycosyltransferase involved in cell wall biosynthesis
MSESLHLGFLSADLTHSHGWAHYSLSLLLALRRAGVRVTVIAARNSPPIDGVEVLPLLPTVDPRESGMLFKQALALPRVHQTFATCNVVHSAIEPYAPLAALVAGNRPLVITGHGSYVRTRHAYAFPTRIACEWAFRRALLVCVSRYTARQAEAAVPGLRTTVVNNGIDVERFAKIASHQASDQPPTVLFVGAVKARKGTLALVRALAQVRASVPNVQCMIVGSLAPDPDYVAQVRSEIEALYLGDCVHLLGRVSDDVLMHWYGVANVFVLPSLNVGWKFEGYGLALMEASAAGLPVISTSGCGAEDAVEDGVTGLLVSQANIDAELPLALIRLLTNPALARRMGDAGRMRAQQHTWDQVARTMIDVYHELLSREEMKADR